jgi:type 1 glutamine amidotransferase
MVSTRTGVRGLSRRSAAAAAAAVVALALAAVLGGAPAQAGAAPPPRTAVSAAGPEDVLVFTRTAGFRHDSVDAGVRAVQEIAGAEGFGVTVTEDPARFTDGTLARVGAVVFLNTTGDVLGPAEQAALEGYVRGGGGFVGVHAAADTEYGWPFYGRLVGAWFASHPPVQPARLVVEDRVHPATADLGSEWRRTDEWYSFRTNPRPGVHVLLRLDGGSFSGGAMGADHPIAWCQPVDAGRSFYTGLGHTAESFADPAVRRHLLGGIRYATGAAPADCAPEQGYERLTDGWPDGWRQAGSGGFTTTDGTLASGGGSGVLLVADRVVGSGSVKVGWRSDGAATPALRWGVDRAAPATSGLQVALDTGEVRDLRTGRVHAPTGPSPGGDPGTWSTSEVRVDGTRMQVVVDGVVVTDLDVGEDARAVAGRVGLVDTGPGVELRGLRVKDGGTGRTVQAEQAAELSGVRPYPKATARGGWTLGEVDPGDWAAFDGVRLTGVTAARARVVSGGPGGTVEVRLGSRAGTLLGRLSVGPTGGWDRFEEVTTPLTGVPAGEHRVVLVFAGQGTGLLDVDELVLLDAGAGPAAPRVGLSGRCLDVAGGSSADGAAVQLWSCNGSPAQAWASTGGTLTALGKCLDVSGGGTAEGTRLQLWRCNGSAAQQWVATGTHTHVNPQSGRCVDVRGATAADGTPVQLWSCNGSPAQAWPEGAGAPAVNAQSSRCLDVPGGTGADGTALQTWACNGTAAQRWVAGPDGSVVNPASGRCLDVRGGQVADGSVVQLWACNGSGAQRWLPGPDGTLRNPQSGRCLDVAGPDAQRAAGLQLWSCHAGANQRWDRAQVRPAA